MNRKPVTVYCVPIFRTGKWGLSILSLVSLSAATVPECTRLQQHGKLAEAQACYTSLANSRDTYTRAEGFWGLERYQDAADQFEVAAGEQKNNANIRVRWGRLYLERFDKAEAGKHFQEALQIDDKNAAAYLGLALVASDGFSIKAVEYAQKAIGLNPKLVEAQELLAFLALEDNDFEKAAKEADKAIAMSPEALDGMAVRG